MGVRLDIDGMIYEAVSYSVQEDATPLAAGDSTGGVGTLNFSIPRPPKDAVVGVRIALLVEDPNNPGFLMEVNP